MSLHSLPSLKRNLSLATLGQPKKFRKLDVNDDDEDQLNHVIQEDYDDVIGESSPLAESSNSDSDSDWRIIRRSPPNHQRSLSLLDSTKITESTDQCLPGTIYVGVSYRIIIEDYEEASAPSVHLEVLNDHYNDEDDLSFYVEGVVIANGSLRIVVTPRARDWTDVNIYRDYCVRLSLDETAFSHPFVTTLYPSVKRLLRSKYNIVDVSTGNSLEDISLVLDDGNKNLVATFSQTSENADLKIKTDLSNLKPGCYTLSCKESTDTFYRIKERVLVLSQMMNKHIRPCIRAQRLLMSPHIDNAGLRISVNWGRRPLKLDMHLLSSVGEHLSHAFYPALSVDSESSQPIEVETCAESGFGPGTIAVREVKSNVLYQIYVENREGAWADFQDRVYTGSHLADSDATVSIWSFHGIMLDRFPLSLDLDNEEASRATSSDCLWWNLLTIDGTTRSISVTNTLSTRRPTLAQLRKRRQQLLSSR